MHLKHIGLVLGFLLGLDIGRNLDTADISIYF